MVHFYWKQMFFFLNMTDSVNSSKVNLKSLKKWSRLLATLFEIWNKQHPYYNNKGFYLEINVIHLYDTEYHSHQSQFCCLIFSKWSFNILWQFGFISGKVTFKNRFWNVEIFLLFSNVHISFSSSAKIGRLSQPSNVRPTAWENV